MATLRSQNGNRRWPRINLASFVPISSAPPLQNSTTSSVRRVTSAASNGAAIKPSQYFRKMLACRRSAPISRQTAASPALMCLFQSAHSAARHTATADRNLSLPARLPHKRTRRRIARPVGRRARRLYLRPVHCSKSSTSRRSLSGKPSMTFATVFHVQNDDDANVGPKRLGSFIASVSVTLGVIMPPLARRERKAPATVAASFARVRLAMSVMRPSDR